MKTKMKKAIVFNLTICCMTLMLYSAKAQITLPFQTSFTTTAEQDQWTQYRLGETPHSSYDWGYAWPDPGLSHNYPVGSNTLTNDWIVSDEFDFAVGAMIDSLRFEGAGFGRPFGIDTVALYLLEGHPNPDSATSQMLLKLFSDSAYDNYAGWITHYDISIPAVSGPAYLAFRYQTVINWLDVTFDDIYISGGNSAIANRKNNSILEFYPNPVQDKLYFDQNIGSKKVSVYNSLGQMVQTEIESTNFIDVASLKRGCYVIELVTSNETFINQFVKE